MKVTDYIVDFFEQKGFKDVFLINGGGCMHIADSFGNSSIMNYWCMHHEQALAMAGEAYSKTKVTPAIVVTTSGPGASNTITGILDCYLDSTPAFFIFGQSKRSQTVLNSGVNGLRQLGVAEAPIIPMISPITKYAKEINDPKKIRYYLEKALYMATSGRPGPVALSIPLDVQSANINDYELECYNEPDESKIISCNQEDIDYITAELRKAKRPVIICGHGVRLSGAMEGLKTFVEKHSIPVVTTFLGIDALEDNNPCNIGRIGTKGTRAGNFALQNSDLVLSLGSRLSVSTIGFEYELFAREARIIVVDIDLTEHKKKTIDIDRIIQADAGSVITKLISHLPDDTCYSEWLIRCQKWKTKYPVVLKEFEDDTSGINYYKIVDEICNYAPSEAVYISDAGSSFFVVAQTLKIKEKQRHITTGGTATMGFAIPAAYGACVAQRNSMIICITGEGSFMQNMQELESIRYHSFNAKIFVMCNNGYYSIRNHQKKFFNDHYVGSEVGSGISFTDLELIANAFKIEFYHINRLSESGSLLDKIFGKDGPALIQVDIDPDMQVMPSNTYMVKPNGILVSKPLEDMYPFLDRDEFKENMIVEMVNE